jgi:hypothetical protein
MLERIRELYWAKPFQPFTIHLADGRAVPVSHPELLAISNSGKTMTVYQLDDSLSIINLSMITDILVKPEPATSKN